jgi:hypothetical protein
MKLEAAATFGGRDLEIGKPRRGFSGISPARGLLRGRFARSILSLFTCCFCCGSRPDEVPDKPLRGFPG